MGAKAEGGEEVRTISLWPSWAKNIETVHFSLPRTIFTKHTHGPSVWSWWKVFSISPVRSSVNLPSSGWNIWIYTRWHKAICVEFYISRGFSRVLDDWPELLPYSVWAICDKADQMESRLPKGYERVSDPRVSLDERGLIL